MAHGGYDGTQSRLLFYLSLCAPTTALLRSAAACIGRQRPQSQEASSPGEPGELRHRKRKIGEPTATGVTGHAALTRLNFRRASTYPAILHRAMYTGRCTGSQQCTPREHGGCTPHDGKIQIPGVLAGGPYSKDLGTRRCSTLNVRGRSYASGH